MKNVTIRRRVFFLRKNSFFYNFTSDIRGVGVGGAVEVDRANLGLFHAGEISGHKSLRCRFCRCMSRLSKCLETHMKLFLKSQPSILIISAKSSESSGSCGWRLWSLRLPGRLFRIIWSLEVGIEMVAAPGAKSGARLRGMKPLLGPAPGPSSPASWESGKVRAKK